MDGDYIKTLSYDEKIVFIKLFCKLIKADGVIDAAEVDFLRTIAVHYGVERQVIADIVKRIGSVDYVSEARKITNRRHALELIKELCVLANTDEDLDDNELDIIISVAEAMGVADKVAVINRWVLDSLIVSEAGRVIMEQKDE